MKNTFPKLSIPLKWMAFFVLMLFKLSQLTAQYVEFECATPEVAAACSGPESDLADYIPTSSDKIKTIRIAFHIMQQSAGNPQNFSQNNPDHTAYLMNIFNRLNSLYSFCNYPACGGDYLPAPLNPRDTRIQFELVGIYYHPDPVGYINYDGSYNNLYCVNTYGICNVMDIFFCQLPGPVTGYGPGTWIMMSNLFSEYNDSFGDSWWGAGNVLGHEIGHCFNIYHSWQCDQKCRFPDICQGGPTTGCVYPCTNEAYDDGCHGSNTGFCQPNDDEPGIAPDWRCSNNMMSYARLTDHISPLQMAAMNKHIVNSNSEALKQNYDNTGDIVIDQPDVVWNTARVVYGDVYIKPGAKLTIRGKVLMPPTGRIIVQRQARLVVEGGHLTTKAPMIGLTVRCITSTVW